MFASSGPENETDFLQVTRPPRFRDFKPVVWAAAALVLFSFAIDLIRLFADH